VEIEQAIGSILLVAGLGLLFLSVRALFFASRSRRWRKVPGSIRSVEITHDEEYDRYGVEVFYRYLIDGDDIMRSNLRFGPPMSFGNRQAAERYSRRYKAGQAHAVFVDPAMPTRSVLVPGFSSAALLGPVFACVLLYWGASILIRPLS